MKNKVIKILLIEDDPGDVDLFQKILAKADYGKFEMEFVDRLSSGLEKLTIGNFDIVLLDLLLPDSQGLDTFLKLQAHTPDVPIVVLTGNDDETFAISVVHKGAQDYFTKGQLGNNLLSRAICYAIERHRLQKELEKAWQKEQDKRDSTQLARNFQHYKAISQDEDTTKRKDSPSFNDEALNVLISDYREIVLKYVRAIRIKEDRPLTQGKDFAQRLSTFKIRARDFVRLHLNVLNEFSQHALLSDELAFSNDARLVLIGLLGNLMDIYLNQRASSANKKKYR